MKVTLSEVPMNNHGCSGEWLELEVVSDKEAIVTDGGSCSSCWQVGHDKNEPRFPVGAKVCLPESARSVKVWSETGSHFDMNSGENYYMSGEIPLNWDNARRMCGYSHNECSEDYDYPKPDTTLIRPSDLILSIP